MSGGHAERKDEYAGNGELAVMRMARALDLFRAMDNTMPSQVISVFLEIAASPDGIETRLLPERVGLTQASVSRAIHYLAETNWKDRRKPGLHLIVRRINPEDARQRIAALTLKGRSLAQQIESILGDD